MLLPFLTGLLTAIIIASNFMAIKLIDVWCFTVPAAVLCYPFSFACGNIITERFDFRTTRKVISLTFLFSAIVIGFLTLASVLPPSCNFAKDEAFRDIFLSVPRILLASFAAFLVSNTLNGFVFEALKKAGKLPLVLRSSASTILGIVVDSVIFIGIAFAGKLPLSILWMTMLGQILAKLVVGVGVGTPLTWGVLKTLGRRKHP